jgi:hypothetical protein
MIVAIALLASGRGPYHTAHFAFTTYVNDTGWTSIVSIIIEIKERNIDYRILL